MLIKMIRIDKTIKVTSLSVEHVSSKRNLLLFLLCIFNIISIINDVNITFCTHVQRSTTNEVHTNIFKQTFETGHCHLLKTY